MTKKTTRLIALILVVLLGVVSIVAVAIDALTQSASAEAARDRYAMRIEVLDALDALRVDQEVTFTNRTGQPLSQVLFTLYPNALRRQITTPIEVSAMDSAYPDGFTPGGADFFSVSVDGKQADWGVQGGNEAFLRVAVDLKAGERCTFRFGYELLLPHCLGPLGVTQMGYQLNFFYPMLATWDDGLKEFSVANPQAVGGCLFPDPADYRATVYAPKGVKLAATGTVSSADVDGRTEWKVEAGGIRQLSMVLTAKSQAYEREANGVKLVALMADGGGANRALDAASKALTFYQGVLGDYPLSTLVIAQVDDIEGARMNSGMITLDDSLLTWDARDELEYQVAMMVAKQWFFEKVSSNPSREPWLSESTSAYMAMRYLGHAYGQARFLQELNARSLPAMQLTLPGGVKVDSETAQFASVNDYKIVMRERGAASMYELSLSVGEDGLYRALRGYIEGHAGKVASLPDFAAALNEVGGRELDHTLMNVLQHIEDYAVIDWYE